MDNPVIAWRTALRFLDKSYFLTVLFLAIQACGDDDSSGEDTETETDTGSESETGTGGCEDIEWEDPDHYLVNGGTVSRWQQTVWFDENDNGQIDESEREDVELDFLELCESDKTSLVLLLATDN